MFENLKKFEVQKPSIIFGGAAEQGGVFNMAAAQNSIANTDDD